MSATLSSPDNLNCTIGAQIIIPDYGGSPVWARKYVKGWQPYACFNMFQELR